MTPPRPLPAHLRGPQRPLVVPPPGGFAASLGEGFGTDPDGDAQRRTEQGVVELPDGTTVAGLPDGHPLALDPPTAAEAEYMERLDRLAVLGGYGLPAARAQQVEREPEVVEAELLDDDPHAITRTDYPSGVSWVCACGQWEGFTTGPSSTAWAGADHRRHVTAVTADGA